MRVLAVDTTTPRGSVALVSQDGVLAEARVLTADGHSRWLLPAVDALLRGAGVDPAALDAFAVTTGPGSFTGLRVGLSSVQGLALASDRPCVGISALELLALGAVERGGPIVALMDAFRGEVYVGVYDSGAAAVRHARVGPLDALAAELPADAVFVGDAVAGRRSWIESACRGARFAEVDLFLATALGRAALERVRQGSTVSASALRPLYLRDADVRPRP